MPRIERFCRCVVSIGKRRADHSAFVFGRSRKRKDNTAQASAAEMYHGLREQILSVDPGAFGLTATDPTDRFWGSLIETGYPNGTATPVCLRDGTTRLFTRSADAFCGRVG